MAHIIGTIPGPVASSKVSVVGPRVVIDVPTVNPPTISQLVVESYFLPGPTKATTKVVHDVTFHSTPDNETYHAEALTVTEAAKWIGKHTAIPTEYLARILEAGDRMAMVGHYLEGVVSK